MRIGDGILDFYGHGAHIACDSSVIVQHRVGYVLPFLAASRGASRHILSTEFPKSSKVV